MDDPPATRLARRALQRLALLKGEPCRQVGRAPAGGRDVVELEHDHVAAVAAAAVEVAAGRRVVLQRRDDLDERVPERHDRVVQPEGADAGIPERLGEAERGAQLGHDGLEIAGDEDGVVCVPRDRISEVERGVQAREIEVAVLGNDGPQASIPGEVQPSREFYSYESKYVDGTSGLLIPAPLPAATAEEIRRMAVDAYKLVDCAGMARVDFFLEKGSEKVYLNEINTIPGFTSISMYPKLWEASGLTYSQLVDRLVGLAFERKADRDHTERRFRSAG